MSELGGDKPVELLQVRWLRDIAAGGRARDLALLDLFDAYDRRMVERAARMGLPEGDAEDVWVQTLAQIERQAARFDAARSSPQGWICMILDSRAKDRLRQLRRRAEQPLGDDLGAPVLEAPDHPGEDRSERPEVDLSGHARERCVHEALQRYEKAFPELGWALLARVRDGIGYDELARRWRCTEVTARKRISLMQQELEPFLLPCRDLPRDQR
jgi:DNA-directed RNA polymerase specialized sigma24 family protein